jgi:hypothetical protein
MKVLLRLTFKYQKHDLRTVSLNIMRMTLKYSKDAQTTSFFIS